MRIDLNSILTGRQKEAWKLLSDRTTTDILFGGAASGGKSFLGCLWLIHNCVAYPGTRWLMGRSVLKTLRETTLNTFFDVARTMGMKLDAHYSYNAVTGVIRIGESEILLKDLFAQPSDPNFDELGSLEITGAFIDEANQVTDKCRQIVSSRIRYKLKEFDLTPKLLMTCNPARNWTYQEFYQPWRNGTLEGHRAFVPAMVDDNPHVPKVYRDQLARMKGADRARLLDGNWEYADDEWQLMTADAVFGLWENDVERGKGVITWDVAGPGSDRSVVDVWEGLVLVDTLILDEPDVNVQARKVEEIARRRGVPNTRIIVDATGIGTGPSQLIRGCFAFNGSARPIKNKDFKNLKAECSYKLAEVVNDGLMAIAHTKHRDETAREMLSLRQWKGDQDGPVQVTPKKEMIKALGRSPDLLDGKVMRMALELRGISIGSQMLRAKGRRYRGEQMRDRMTRTFMGWDTANRLPGGGER